LFLLAFCCTVSNLFAQKKDTINVGTATGLLKDSVHNYVMASATVSIYKIADNKLINFQLVNTFGRFQFKLLPVGVPLRLVGTFVGYAPAEKVFTISPKTKTIDLKTINIERQDMTLKEVKIKATPPPMQMHGDTLEFNADAFKLDTNAVVEDWLRKVPGITVWGDGTITVNGKKISQLFVEGKPFFGSDNKIALQNLPKNAVKKIQVYDDVDKLNPDFDANNIKTNMNIVLKDDKKDGYFGKIGGGYGTDKRYVGDGMISYFSPKNQLSVVGALNNVNKTANDVNVLMGFNSFKGEGLNNPYNSDFTRQGLNVFKALGLYYLRDLSDPTDSRPASQKEHQLKAGYFFSGGNTQVLQQTQTLADLSANEQLKKTGYGTTNNTNTSQRADAAYTKRLKNGNIDVSLNYRNNKTDGVNTQGQTSFNTLTSQQSSSNARQENSLLSNNITGALKLNTQRDYDSRGNHKGIDLDLDYKVELNNDNNDSKRITDFKSTDVGQDRYSNRHYLTNTQSVDQTLTAGIPSLLSRVLGPFSPSFENTLSFYDRRQNNDVDNLLSGATQYTPNTILTNITHYQTIDERPALSFSKGFKSELADRYSKRLSISVVARGQMFLQNNTSQKDFQNLNKSYFYFIPSSSINYTNSQFGDFTKRYSLSYTTAVTYPIMDQLAPLNDDANVYTVLVGDLNLRPVYRHDLAFNYDYNSTMAKNPLATNLRITAGIDKNPFTDSVFYDGLGRNVRYTTNGESSRHASFMAVLRKTFKFKDNQLEFSTYNNGGYSQYPSSTNGINYSTTSTRIDLSGHVSYSYQGIFTTEVGESFWANKTIQGNLSRNYFYNWGTNAGIAFALPKSIFFNTRINFNNTKASNNANIYSTIWNANIGYRFLKGANAEVKFSALDILHQNKNVFNYVSNNSVTTSTANVLQQYFLVTLAYYPRKFGLKK
jgi:hypothetical protein